jgi:glutamyl-tRNA(Gln) amidotransferase subunit E
MASQMVREGTDELFESVAREHPIVTASAATTFTGTFTEIEREGLSPFDVDDAVVMQVFARLAEGEYAKEALPDIFRLLAGGSTLDDSIKKLGLECVGEEDALKIIRRIVREREEFIRQKGVNAVGPLMGAVMAELKGKIDGKRASELLEAEISSILGE